MSHGIWALHWSVVFYYYLVNSYYYYYAHINRLTVFQLNLQVSAPLPGGWLSVTYDDDDDDDNNIKEN